MSWKSRLFPQSREDVAVATAEGLAVSDEVDTAELVDVDVAEVESE